ncbi:MAG: hypothetical protein HY377_02500 [Candidatus Blackburnbacteria bacterium]|nr:hypothetical protein [Candidatus Blackburnbacteria bacterium]
MVHELPGVRLEDGCVIPQLREQVLAVIEHLPTGDSQETQGDRKAVENVLDLLEREGGIQGIAVLYDPKSHRVYLPIFGEDRWPSPVEKTLAQVELMSKAVNPTHAPVIPTIVEKGCVLDGFCGCSVVFDSRAKAVVPSPQSA